ncbi:MAG: acetyl-CoA acetyltransferase [Pseudomonadales bacterium]|jgi:acetyl-CoA C-acetyltransferase|nr:acetyl-CoA acetyltransferase [Pseudomonadales bacterium]MDP6472801.1 acetyl-CoA acetyltransferase [Pseudomonadales bacterium]MDP6828016.1 acetyl-CoA acetyltransferase [Pseudomonadales bacterium]MDP6970583.1 acetyl-CoA acetyltransferase [Pseudomonadales bacterium]|tara:strand:- start:3565 stop:5034 length:1470 start_codon:yes stop_codon:yes gene_type:complete
MNDNTPIIVGAAQVLNRARTADDSLEPLAMMVRASRLAEEDTGAIGLLEKLQSVRVIRGMWSYANPAGYLAEQFGAVGAQTLGTLFGGNQNQAVLNRTAASILAGEMDLVLITGAENGNSATKARKVGRTIELTETPGEYDVVVGSQKPEHHDYEIEKGIRTAIQAYPMYENAIRHHRGETLEAHMQRVSALWSRFSEVAAENPNAWIRERVSAHDIATPSAVNRRISFPYTKLMNANMSVDMGAALIMSSVGRAKQLGIHRSKWVFPWAGAEGKDHFSASVRDNFYTSPGIRFVGGRVLELAGLTPDDLDHVDLYSCFPSAVQVAAAELGLSETRPLTVTGGLTFGGGPINNYVMHAIARIVELLRERPEARALVTANGGNLYKHAHGVYSGEPPAAPFRVDDLQKSIDALPSRVCLPEYRGEARVESYTVMFGAEGADIAHIACRTPAGERVWVNTQDGDVMQAMTEEEFCGRDVKIDVEGRIAFGG